MWKQLINYIILAFGCILVTTLICRRCYRVAVPKGDSFYLSEQNDSLQRKIKMSGITIDFLKRTIEYDQIVIDSLKRKNLELKKSEVQEKRKIDNYTPDSLEIWIRQKLQEYEDN